MMQHSGLRLHTSATPLRLPAIKNVPRRCRAFVAPPSASATLTNGTPTAKYYTSESVAPPARGHHFLHIDDFTKEQLEAMLETAKLVKAKIKADDQSYKPFAGKSLAMIFTKPSMRTRVSFETVRANLGRPIGSMVGNV